MNIFFDLDGTLIDSRERLYNLFQHLVPESDFSFDEYWAFKRSKINHKEILEKKFQYSINRIDDFNTRWMKKIELPEWILFDKPFNGITPFLFELKKKHSLFIVTARQFEPVVLQQIKNYGWENLFKKVFVTGHKHEKYDLITTSIKVKAGDWFVGDTGTDIMTGKKLGINTAAVLSGFLNKETLMTYGPDLIEDNVTKLTFT